MENRELVSILVAMKWKIVSIQQNFGYYQRMLQDGNFHVGDWNSFNETNMREMVELMDTYQRMANANLQLVGFYRIYQFYWHHAADAFARETPAWRMNNLHFLEERVVSTSELIDRFDREIEKFGARANANHFGQ